MRANVAVMPKAKLDVLIQPFKENSPGPHVAAAVNALSNHGLNPDMGPFATTVEGDLAHITGALADLVSAAVEKGATTVQLVIEVAPSE
jgi:uncharacterized protein YqgV (UPF0045/DUF77 family)